MELLTFGLIALLVIAAAAWLLRSPFHYPYCEHKFDVSGKRNVAIEDTVERFLLDRRNVESLRAHAKAIEVWKRESEASIERYWLKGLRRRQFEESIDDGHAFIFVTTRQQTRYKQVNYVKTSYKVTVDDARVAVSWGWIEARVAVLVAIGYECTRREYHSKNQRKLMTPSLRKQIMERDGYRCQMCGKFMPDQVGLHIDHIVPVAKGGKTVPSNLQVLCSRCNGSKGKK